MGAVEISRVDSASRRSQQKPRPKFERWLRYSGWWLRVVSGVVSCAALVLILSMISEFGISSATTMDYGLAVMPIGVLILVVWPGMWAAQFRQHLGLFAVGTLIAIAMLEGYIRAFDPFPIQLRGGRISLPLNAERHFSSNGVPGLDDTISVRFNSLGFRGPEPPEDWANSTTIICVGGSTTQCLYLSDGTTWADRLSEKVSKDIDNLWLNNAGIDGHSTFGHLELLDQYLAGLQPRLLLFLVGLNDVDRSDLNQSDLITLRTQIRASDSPFQVLQRQLLRNSDTLALLDNFRLQWIAQRKGLTHGEPIAHRKLSADAAMQTLSLDARRDWLNARDPDCLAGYESRLKALVDRCHSLGIDCILITQPVLYGVGIDDATSIDLEQIQVGEVDGATQWQLLQQYNQVTLSVGASRGVPVIDLASKLPKSSRYFYDLSHYNTAGAEKVASILYEDLSPILLERNQ